MNERFIHILGPVPASTADERLDQLLRAATRVFARAGFRRTQMADVAAELGMSVGTIYRHAESKEALFHACLVAASPAGPDLSDRRPLPTPTNEETVAVIHAGLRAIRRGSVLGQVLRVEEPEDIVAELSAVIGDLHDRTRDSRRFQALVEGSAQDRPELFDAFFVDMRRPALDALRTYLERRISTGHLRPVPDVATTARLVNETQSWFARNLYGDPDTDDVDRDLARATVIDVLVNGLLPPPR